MSKSAISLGRAVQRVVDVERRRRRDRRSANTSPWASAAGTSIRPCVALSTSSKPGSAPGKRSRRPSNAYVQAWYGQRIERSPYPHGAVEQRRAAVAAHVDERPHRPVAPGGRPPAAPCRRSASRSRRGRAARTTGRRARAGAWNRTRELVGEAVAATCSADAGLCRDAGPSGPGRGASAPCEPAQQLDLSFVAHRRPSESARHVEAAGHAEDLPGQHPRRLGHQPGAPWRRCRPPPGAGAAGSPSPCRRSACRRTRCRPATGCPHRSRRPRG